MPDYSSSQLAIGAGSTVAVSTLVFLMLQAVKDFAPNLAGRAALTVLYILSALVAAALTAQTTPDWFEYTTYLTIVVATVSISIIAKGIYAQLFHQSVPNLPPPSDERIVSVETEPADEPYDAEERAPIAPAVMATVQRESVAPRGTRRTKGTV